MTNETSNAAAGPTEDFRPLAQRLADQLADAGDLRSEAWRAAVEAVPRHLFVPAFFRETDSPRETLWEPVTRERIGDAEWLRLSYTNETWVTQLDHDILPEQRETPSPGVPTSSSTLPGLVVMMLEELDVTDTVRVLEIGTGTGYSTALLSHRIGPQQVTSIEVDPTVAAKAAASLRQAGHQPELIVGDGLAGHPASGPYDRIIATCSARNVPAEWIRQTRPGGHILMTLTGWRGASSGLIRITIDQPTDSDDNPTGVVGHGQFLGDYVSFMPARAHEAPPLDRDIFELVQATGIERPTRFGMDVLNPANDWTAAFIAQLAAPTAQQVSFSIDGGPMIDYLIDQQHQSYAALLPQPDGTHVVRQLGPLAIWDAIEDAINTWRDAGAPTLDKFELTITNAQQTIRSPASAAGQHQEWQLPDKVTPARGLT
jgi:methyltransferase of ATP-grasp peptide maturase system